MRSYGILGCSILLLLICPVAQENLPLFRAEAASAFVWGEDTPAGAVSSVVADPLTGSEILKLSHAGIEVSSRIGFEKTSGLPGVLIAYTTTIVNNSSKNLPVKYGVSTIDGHVIMPLWAGPGTAPRRGKRMQPDPNNVDVAGMYCFSSGLLSQDNFFPTPGRSGTLTVESRSSLRVSTVIRDPRPYPIMCSLDGCLPKGKVGYSIQVGSQDFIFIRSGRSLTDCGK